MTKLTDQAVEAALRKMHGNISAAARSLDVTRHALQKRIGNNADLLQVLTDCRETMVDDAESVLAQAVLAGEKWAVQYLLSTQGHKRGYALKHVVSGDRDAPIHLHHSGSISHEPSLEAADAQFAEALAAQAGANAEEKGPGEEAETGPEAGPEAGPGPRPGPRPDPDAAEDGAAGA